MTTTCNLSGGVGIGAGHECRCVRAPGHPLDSARPHGCSCGALWADPPIVHPQDGDAIRLGRSFEL